VGAYNTRSLTQGKYRDDIFTSEAVKNREDGSSFYHVLLPEAKNHQAISGLLTMLSALKPRVFFIQPHTQTSFKIRIFDSQLSNNALFSACGRTGSQNVRLTKNNLLKSIC